MGASESALTDVGVCALPSTKRQCWDRSLTRAEYLMLTTADHKVAVKNDVDHASWYTMSSAYQFTGGQCSFTIILEYYESVTDVRVGVLGVQPAHSQQQDGKGVCVGAVNSGIAIGSDQYVHMNGSRYLDNNGREVQIVNRFRKGIMIRCSFDMDASTIWFTVDGTSSPPIPYQFKAMGYQAAVSFKGTASLQVRLFEVTDGINRTYGNCISDPPPNFLSSPQQSLTLLRNAVMTASEKLTIGLFGLPKVGKSTLINSLLTALESTDDQVIYKAGAGRHVDHTTKKIGNYAIMGSNICLRDTWGLEPALLNAHLPGVLDGYLTAPFDKAGVATMGTPGYNPTPTNDDMMHAVIFVMDALAVPEGSKVLKQAIKMCKEKGYAPIIVLTKLDLTDCRLQKQPELVYESRGLGHLIPEAERKFAVDGREIYPSRPYIDERRRICAVEVSVVWALLCAVRNAKLFRTNA